MEQWVPLSEMTWAGAFTVVGSVLAVVVGFLGLYRSVYRKERVSRDDTEMVTHLSHELMTMRTELNRLDRDILLIRQNVDGSMSTSMTEVNTKVNAIQRENERINTRIDKLTETMIDFLKNRG